MASVDVVVPCYQYGHFLRDCVTSVLTQHISDLRVLIIDNASTDDSLEVARSLAAADSRVEVIAHSRNLGHLASFNEGIDWASADYFMVLCADDLLAPECLSRGMSIMEQHPEVVLTHGAVTVIRPDEPIPTIAENLNEATWRIEPGNQLVERCCRMARGVIDGPTALVRTSAQKQVGHYRTGLPHTNDLEVWLRLACLGAIARTDAILGIARQHPNNRSSSVSNIREWDRHFEAAFRSFFAHEGGSLPNAKRLRRSVRRGLSERAYWGSVTTLLRGDPRLSFQLMKFAITRWPVNLFIPPFSYLFCREDSLVRISEVLSDAAWRLRGVVRGRRDA
jgi:glycosyltransferase involved in cell wall biosynthesis